MTTPQSHPPLPAPHSVGRLNMDLVKIDPAWALRVPSALALRRQVLAFALVSGEVCVACVNEHDAVALQTVERHVGAPVRAHPADPESLRRALHRVYGDPKTAAAGQRARSVDLRSTAVLEPDDMIALGEELLHAAVLRDASDIHIDPDENGVLIRFRVEGVLDRYRYLPQSVHGPLVSRFKVLSGMDIAEKRAPQDGGFRYRFPPTGKTIDIRTATLPARYGERMTLRLLALETESLTLERLGMVPRDLALLERAIDRPHGLILLTGPTGSGKTTTLYAALRRLIGRENLNVITIEDPIEYDIAGVAQVEVDSADKVSFQKALRSVLRHDPDVVMIGEIRDGDTADVAMKAALTGHLVFSTLHTNSAAGVITRLADMGVDRYLIAASLRLAVAQRLVRQLCTHCRKPRELTVAEAAGLGRPALAGQIVHDPGGCLYCADRGYRGRLGLFEFLPVDEALSQRITTGTEETELQALIRERQIPTLVDDALEKLLAGVTSLREVLNAVAV